MYHFAIIHSVTDRETDRETDRQTDDGMMPGSAKTVQYVYILNFCKIKST